MHLVQANFLREQISFLYTTNWLSLEVYGLLHCNIYTLYMLYIPAYSSWPKQQSLTKCKYMMSLSKHKKGGGLLVWIQIRPTHTLKTQYTHTVSQNLTAQPRKERDHAAEQVDAEITSSYSETDLGVPVCPRWPSHNRAGLAIQPCVSDPNRWQPINTPSDTL